MYSSAPWDPIWSTCQSFTFLFLLPRTWFSMRNAAGVSRKAEDACPTSAPGPCPQLSEVRVAHILLLLCMYYFGYFMFSVLCFVCLCSLSGLCLWIIFLWFPLESWLLFYPLFRLKCLYHDRNIAVSAASGCNICFVRFFWNWLDYWSDYCSVILLLPLFILYIWCLYFSIVSLKQVLNTLIPWTPLIST